MKNIFNKFKGLTKAPTREPPLVISIGDVILIHGRETRMGPITNVPRFYTFSGNDNWGYFGTGPRCLAQNIIFYFTSGNEEFVQRHWIAFLLEVISKLPSDKSCTLGQEVIESWIEKVQNTQNAEVIPFPHK